MTILEYILFAILAMWLIAGAIAILLLVLSIVKIVLFLPFLVIKSLIRFVM